MNDWPNERMEVTDENTTKAFKAVKGYINHGYLPVHFFWMSLNSRGRLLTTYVYFLTSMNYVLKLLGEKFACPQYNNANRGACPPSFIASNSVVGMKVYLGDLFHFSMRLIQDRNYPRLLVSFFNEVDTR